MFHATTICHEIAERMQNPLKLREAVQESIYRNSFPSSIWLEKSFAEGYPGIACFYGVMDWLYPSEGWDKVCYEYLKLTGEEYEQNGHQSSSLFSGLSGFCFALNLCSHRGKYYQKVLETLEAVLIQEVENDFLQKTSLYLEKNVEVPMNFYNLAMGLCGVLAYLITRKDNAHLYQIATRCISLLISLYQHNESLPLGIEKNESQSHFLLNLPYGSIGLLSTLSIATLEGFTCDGLQETISSLALWIRKQCITLDDFPYWPNSVSLPPNAQKETLRDTWWFGIPAVTRSLYLASKALCERDLEHFATENFLSMFSKPRESWNLVGTSFFYGLAGVLTITYQMAESTQIPFLWQQVDALENDLLSNYNPDSLFGFQVMDYKNGIQRWIDHPGVLNGVIGIALSLLTVQKREIPKWDRAFLLQ